MIAAKPSVCCSVCCCFFFFSTFLPSLSSCACSNHHCKELCREISERKVQGKRWEGQVRTEKGKRKRSVTQAQSDGCPSAELLCCLSVVRYFFSATIHTSGDHSSFHRPRSSSPLTGAEQGRGGRRERAAAPSCRHRFQDGRGEKNLRVVLFDHPLGIEDV